MKKIGFLEVTIFGSSLLILGLMIWFLSLVFFGSSVDSKAQIMATLSTMEAAHVAGLAPGSGQKAVPAGSGFPAPPQQQAQAFAPEPAVKMEPAQQPEPQAAPAMGSPAAQQIPQPSAAVETPQQDLSRNMPTPPASEGEGQATNQQTQAAAAEAQQAAVDSVTPPASSVFADPVSAPPRPGQEEAALRPSMEMSAQTAPPADIPVAPAPPVSSAAEAPVAADQIESTPQRAIQEPPVKPQETVAPAAAPAPRQPSAEALSDFKVAYEPRSGRDPTITPEELRQVDRIRKQKEDEERRRLEAEAARRKANDPFEIVKKKISIQGVLHTDEGVLVIVNNQILKRGESYMGAKIVQIQGNRVIFKFKDRIFHKTFSGGE
ncbi:MAG: hypothetical protein HYT79_01535 [Elusimicrobia bacterium]|nr:hypothetical protein [Elusimicrobiota bacterium]